MAASRVCRAVLLCQARRALGGAQRAPVPVAAIVGSLALGPVVLARAAGAAAPSLGPALGDVAVARAALLGGALPCLAAGAAVALTAATPLSSLGPQIVATPVRRTTLAMATVGVPVAGGAVLVAPLAWLVVSPIFAASPGGRPAGLVAALALLAATLAGGALAEAFRHAIVGRSRVVIGSFAALAGSLWVGAATRAAPLGPLDPAANAVAGKGALGTAGCLTAMAAIGSAIAWITLAAMRPPPRPAGDRRSIRMPAQPGTACLRSAVALLARRGDLRGASAAAFALGVTGLLVAWIARAAAPAGVLLGATAAVVAAAPIGLAVMGALASGRHVWTSAPVRRSRVALAWAGASFAVTSLAVVVAILPAAAAERPSGSALGSSAILIVLGWASALLAGVLIPWRPGAVSDQVAALAGFALVVGCASALMAFAGPRLVGLGMPPALAAALLVCVVTGIALGGLRHGLERRA